MRNNDVRFEAVRPGYLRAQSSNIRNIITITSIALTIQSSSLLGEMDDRGSDRIGRGAPRESKTAREH